MLVSPGISLTEVVVSLLPADSSRGGNDLVNDHSNASHSLQKTHRNMRQSMCSRLVRFTWSVQMYQCTVHTGNVGHLRQRKSGGRNGKPQAGCETGNRRYGAEGITEGPAYSNRMLGYVYTRQPPGLQHAVCIPIDSLTVSKLSKSRGNSSPANHASLSYCTPFICSN